MIKGDYIERTRKAKSGKIVTDKIVRSTTGEEYAIGPKLWTSGVRNIYRVRRLSDQKEYLFKEYNLYSKDVRVNNDMKRDIQNLIDHFPTEEDGKTPLKSFVGPMDFIELPQSKGFGYVMESLDTNSFLPIPSLWHKDTYPDDATMYKACRNIAALFRRIHMKGLCFKDINEGNIYINNKTGEVRVMECNNIIVQSVKCIKGSDGYMAPEIYVNNTPDMYTDYFSMAVLFYRLLVGGYPMEGKRTMDYLITNNLSLYEAASTIYGSTALFTFDPEDQSNTIRDLVDSVTPRMYELQTQRWDNLPVEIQQRFIQTFSTGLSSDHRYKRTTDQEWMKTFEGFF